MQYLASIRSTLRRARRALTEDSQKRHAEAVATRLYGLIALSQARRIAFYWPADGELDPLPLMQRLIALGKHAYLPVLSSRPPGKPRPRLWFARYRPQEPMRPNRFGIPEPVAHGPHLLPARDLDLLIMPLVGFDASRNRIGMGGGYYDRSLAFLRFRHHWRHPKLIGVAHECQRLERIEPAPWDVQLDAVATESRLYLNRQDQKIEPRALCYDSPPQ